MSRGHRARVTTTAEKVDIMSTRTRAGIAAIALVGVFGVSACQADVTVVGGSSGNPSAPTDQGTSDGGSSSAPTSDGGSASSSGPDQKSGPTHKDVDFPKTKPSPGDIDGKVVANDDDRKAVPDTTLPVFAPDDSKADDLGKIPNAEWPDAQQLFSVKELKHVFPDASSISIRNCLPKKDYSTDSLTAHNATCDMMIKMPGDDYSTSKVTVTIQGVGTEDYMLDGFDDYRKIDRKTTKDLKDQKKVFYYKDGAFGTQRYTNSFGTADVVIGNGKAAMEVRLAPSGFSELAGEDHRYDYSSKKESPADKVFREQIMPLLLQLLVQRM